MTIRTVPKVDTREYNTNYWKTWVKKTAKPLEAKSKKKLRIVDLFSGCGGMTLGVIEGAAAAGYGCSISLAADTFSEAAHIYQQNFSSSIENFFDADLSTLFPPEGTQRSPQKLVVKYGRVDILVAGPPCQGHSNLNNSTRRNDPRNQLYLSAITAIEVLKPKIAIVENVPAVIHDKTGVTLSSHARLIKAGYFVEELVLHMDKLGMPQRRKRHLLVAQVGEPPNLSALLQKQVVHPATLREFIEDISKVSLNRSTLFDTPSKMSPENTRRVQALFRRDIFDLPDTLRPPCHREKEHSYKSAYGRMHWDQPAQTITSGFGSMGQGRYVHPSEPRTITPHEAARIQGFPDFFEFSSAVKRTALQEIIANAVPPPVMAMIIRVLLSKKSL